MVTGVRSSSGISRTLTSVNRSVISHVRDSPDEVPVEKTRKCLCGVVEFLASHFPFGNKVYVARAESLLWLHHLSHNAPVTAYLHSLLNYNCGRLVTITEGFPTVITGPEAEAKMTSN